MNFCYITAFQQIDEALPESYYMYLCSVSGLHGHKHIRYNYTAD